MNSLKVWPKFQKIKISNSIVVGGMIAFGKSTLSKSISDSIENSQVIFELNDNDLLMKLLLEKMYERSNDLLYGSVFQLFFILNRFDLYKANCNMPNKLTVFDRSIFEDWLFAHENIIRPSVFNYYDSLWREVCNELIYSYGVPKLYVILDGDWDLFKERIFKRNRKVEVDNFTKNEQYFRNLLKIYKDYMVNLCKDYGINYIIIDANLKTEEQVKLVKNKLNELNI